MTLVHYRSSNPPKWGYNPNWALANSSAQYHDVSRSDIQVSGRCIVSPGSEDHKVLVGMSCRVTVHDFVALAGASTSRSTLQLERGRDLVFVCSGHTRWVTPQSTIDPSLFTLHRNRLYRYRMVPPPLTARVGIVSIPEWGQLPQADDPDCSRLRDLQEFESTDFQPSLMRPRTGIVHPAQQAKRIQSDVSSVDKPARYPPLDTSTILHLVPQPHFIPAPAAEFEPVDVKKIPPFEKTLPLPVAPYNMAAVNELLSGRFRRAAWLIPVRGSLPWDGASKAVISVETQLAARSPSPRLPMPASQSCTIMWTPDSLQHLWTFLGSIQQAKHLGPLSLSFHAAPVDAFLTGDTPVWESNRPSYYHQRSSKHTTVSLGSFATDICEAHLEGIDYIKVYHDVPYSLSLRNILDAYRYVSANGEAPGQSGANDRKIRILKGARLVFMDEQSKPAFLM